MVLLKSDLDVLQIFPVASRFVSVPCSKEVYQEITVESISIGIHYFFLFSTITTGDWINQGTLTEGEGSVRLTSCLVK